MNPRSHAEPAALPSGFGSIPFTEQETHHIATQLKQQLGPEFVSTRQGPGGAGKLSYIEGWKVTNIANDIFGFNGWANKVVDITVDFVDVENGKVSTGISSIVRVTLKDGSYHEDVGYGSIDNARTKSAAFEKAKKESITDATKRALKHFGNSMGACLYNKDYCKKIARIPVKPKEFHVDNLYRHEDFRTAPLPQAPNRSAGMNNLPAAAPAAPQTNAQAAKSRNAVQVPANGNASAVSSETAGFGDDDDDLMFASEFDVDEKFLHMPMQQVPTPPQNMQPSKNTPDAPNGRPNGGVSAGTAQPTGQSPTAAIAKQGNAAAFQPGPGGSRVNNMGAPTPMPGGQNKQPQTNMQSSTKTAIRPQQQTPAPTNNNQPPPSRPVAMPAQPQLGTPQIANMQQRPPQGQSVPPHMANMQQRPPQKINNNQQQNQLQYQQQQQPQQLHQQRMQAANAAHLPQPLVAQRSAPGALAGRPQVPITPIGQQLRPHGQLQGGTTQPMNPGVKRPSEGAEQQVGNAGSPNLIGNRKPADPIRPPDGSNVQGGSGSGGVTNGGGEQATVAGYQYANRVTKRPRAEIPGFS